MGALNTYFWGHANSFTGDSNTYFRFRFDLVGHVLPRGLNTYFRGEKV